MKNYVMTSVLLGMLLTACSRNNEPAPTDSNNSMDKLHQQFHGKYKLVRSVSDMAVDLNMDGITSTDMTKEYYTLESTELRIDLRAGGLYTADDVFVFTQAWLEQYVYTPAGNWKGELVDYEKGARVDQVHQGSSYLFTLSTDRKSLYVQAGSNQSPDSAFRWVRPESVTVESDGRLTVVNKRRVYTSAGVKDIYITTLYQRYTMTT
ncbi:hypothetical protein CLV58_12278 [Spirosoma oryzae]|uniref:Uncharacterized protein n=1 Tax=Spirosoma oryzae TaxID=1469603 RepID=A0A2T0SEG4_9BACT|nr:hypothetical protein [Spirosoma oryzae]PRY31781.1 hypothetical protein CLV58_12278 [Spirosoma oryzae]